MPVIEMLLIDRAVGIVWMIAGFLFFCLYGGCVVFVWMIWICDREEDIGGGRGGFGIITLE